MTNMEASNANIPAMPYPNMNMSKNMASSKPDMGTSPQGSDAVSNKVSMILTQILQTVNEIGIELAVLDDDKCKSCPLVHKCRRLIKQFKEMIELSRR